jgi:hypothetical protein
MRRQPQARVFITEPTVEIGSVLLHNSVNCDAACVKAWDRWYPPSLIVKLIAPLTVGNRARSGSPTRFRVNEHRTRMLTQLRPNFRRRTRSWFNRNSPSR